MPQAITPTSTKPASAVVQRVSSSSKTKNELPAHFRWMPNNSIKPMTRAMRPGTRR